MDLIINSDTPLKGTIQISITRAATEVLYYYSDLSLGEEHQGVTYVAIGPYMGEYTEVTPGSLIPGSQQLVYEMINDT